jgi:hypothetical protein
MRRWWRRRSRAPILARELAVDVTRLGRGSEMVARVLGGQQRRLAKRNTASNRRPRGQKVEDDGSDGWVPLVSDTSLRLDWAGPVG